MFTKLDLSETKEQLFVVIEDFNYRYMYVFCCQFVKRLLCFPTSLGKQNELSSGCTAKRGYYIVPQFSCVSDNTWSRTSLSSDQINQRNKWSVFYVTIILWGTFLEQHQLYLLLYARTYKLADTVFDQANDKRIHWLRRSRHEHMAAWGSISNVPPRQK